LRALRKIVKATVPGMTERVAYGVPYYSLPGRGFVTAFAARRKQKDLSLYATPSMVKKFAHELKPWDVAGGTVHFPADKPLPATLVKRIIRARLAFNAAAKKKRLKPGVNAGRVRR
jgi:uncharacterized protein YdhG (YjbR/CyaY superfamily)